MRLKFRRAIIFPEFGTARRKPQRIQHDTLFLYTKCRCKEESRPPTPPVTKEGQFLVRLIIIIIIIIIAVVVVNCSWVVTRWQWLFYMYTKYEIGD